MLAMATLNIEVPSELPSALGKRPADRAREIHILAGLTMFECERISGGMAAELAGVPRAEFVALCGQHGLNVFQQTAEELIADVKNDRLYASSLIRLCS
jgi:predicted HTH domain antitoxin